MLLLPAQGCIMAIQRGDSAGGSAVYETLQEVKGDMIKAGLRFNKRTHALFVEAHLLECNAEAGPPPPSTLLLRSNCHLPHHFLWHWDTVQHDKQDKDAVVAATSLPPAQGSIVRFVTSKTRTQLWLQHHFCWLWGTSSVS